MIQDDLLLLARLGGLLREDFTIESSESLSKSMSLD